MIMVDVDGLAPEAIGRLMQGSRQGFYQGVIREAIAKRIINTLKEDPDLVRLEEEAEEAVSELSAGNEKVRQTLDHLIDSHHDKGSSLVEGSATAGDSRDADELGFKIINKGGVVSLLPPDTGQPADYPVLRSQPAASTIRLRPNQPREIAIKSIPSGHWAAISQLVVEPDPRVLELSVSKEKLDDHGKLTLTFKEPEGFDEDEYPLHATVKVTARFNGIAEPRRLDLGVLVKPDVPRPDPILLDSPTKLKVTSRQPIKIRRGDTATHVRLRWDGKDRLLTAEVPTWKLSAKLLAPGKPQPDMHFSDPLSGRFSLLVSPDPDWQLGEKLKFEVTAIGPGGVELLAIIDAEVVDPPMKEEEPAKGPRLVDSEFKTGSMRRPPYELKIIKRDEYEQPCWNSSEWTDDDAGAYTNPTERAPLILIINEDMGALRDFRQALTKRNTEQDVQRKMNKYTSHIAFHLWQMYQATVGKKDTDIDAADQARREEVRRVALTMITLMDVAER